MPKYTVVTTFPNHYWDVCAKKMVTSFCHYWPKDVDLIISLDDASLVDEVVNIVDQERKVFITTEIAPEHAAFVKRNHDKDHQTDYRKQAVRFSHKPAHLVEVFDTLNDNDDLGRPDYVLWIDADTLTTKTVTHEWLQSIMPDENQDIAYLGRKDWPHSECGFIAFKFNQFTSRFIRSVWNYYNTDELFKQEQWDDSWIFDLVRKDSDPKHFKNLSEGVSGNHVWPKTALAECMQHMKGPIAKGIAAKPEPQNTGVMVDGGNGKMVPLTVQTVNAIPDEEILNNIEENRKIIKNWIKECKIHDEAALMVSAGTSLDIELVKQFKGKIIAVKHAVSRLVEEGITPWAVILLDPRGHVADFIDKIPKETVVFVASQCEPEVSKQLLEKGYRVYGYHAPVNVKHSWQDGDILINGGSATATRGLFLLYALGFRTFELFGYDLCYFNKQKQQKNDHGSPKYLEVEMETRWLHCNEKRTWWTEGQFVAQVNEMRQILMAPNMSIRAHGEGIVPWLWRAKRRSDLIEKRLMDKLPKVEPVSLDALLEETLWKN